MSKKYTKLAKDIIREVGGKDNVNSLRHCITRLRFRLKDESIANDDNLKNMDGVITVVKAAGEYMVVIGEHVADVYDEVCEQLGISESGGQKDAEPERKKGILGFFDVIKAGMGPIVNLLCAAGIIKGLLVVFAFLGLSTESAIYMLLNAAGDALFYFLPVIMSYNVAKHLGIDPYFGLLFASALVYPTIQGVDLNLFGMTVNATYTSSFLPVLFGLAAAAPLYKFLEKHISPLFKNFLVPMLTLLIVFPLTFIFIGPVANMIGAGLNYVFVFLFDKAPLIGCVLLGGLWQILVMFGVHGIPTAFAFMSLLQGNPNMLLAAISGVCFGVAGILFAGAVKTKSNDFRSTCASAGISAVLGVTEPGMYGVIIPRKVMLVISCITGAVAGLIVALFGMKMYTYAGMGIIGMLGLINPESPQFIAIALLVIVPFVLGFVLTTMLYKDDSEDKPAETPVKDDNRAESICMPVNGTVKSLSESSDEVFASEALGKGVMILPENGEIVSPVTGTIRTLFPTKHAVGIVTDNGCEVLLHIGINTVNLQGKYFTAYINQGDKVEKGQKLVSFDKEAVEKEGYSSEILMIITNSNDYLDIITMQSGAANAGSDVLRILG